MEKENWIETVMESTNGITKVIPSKTLFSKITFKINQEKKASPQTIWLVAASILVLVLLNIAAIKTQRFSKQETSSVYLSGTLNQSNQLYQ
jgi:predicted lactoylglutathione lyase